MTPILSNISKGRAVSPRPPFEVSHHPSTGNSSITPLARQRPTRYSLPATRYSDGGSAAAFTIVEVIVTLAIFALAALAIGTAYLNVLTSYEHAKEAGAQDQTLQFARACLFATAKIETAEEGADFETADGKRCIWRATLEPTLIADLFAVTLEVEIIDPDKSSPTLITENFNLFRPTWSLAADREALRLETRKQMQDLQLNTPSSTQ